MTCIAMLDILSNQTAAELYTTETLLATIQLADYYDIAIVVQSCTIQVLAHIGFSNLDLVKTLEFCESLSNVHIDTLHQISKKAALQVISQSHSLSQTISAMPSMCKITFEWISKAMEGSIVTLA